MISVPRCILNKNWVMERAKCCRHLQTTRVKTAPTPPNLANSLNLAAWKWAGTKIDRVPKAVGFTSRGYGSKMGKCICCEVVVDEDEQPPVIITAYRTSKIEKYWSAE